MITPLTKALHPLSFQFADTLSGLESRDMQVALWDRIHGAGVAVPPQRLVAEFPLVASARLQLELDRHVAELVAFLAQEHAGYTANMLPWPGLSGPDVVSADMAIVEDPEAPEGWSLRWVEFQAFTSLLSTMYTYHLAANELWPETRGLAPWRLPAGDHEWLPTVRQWAAPNGGILLERAPDLQGSRFDLQAAAKYFGLSIVEPHQLERIGRTLAYRDSAGAQHEIRHVFNRLVMHELADRAAFEQLMASAEVTWHSHPAWYYGISKACLQRLPQRLGAQCVMATHWRELGLPAGVLVAKNVNSHGGSQVLLNVDDLILDSLTSPGEWLIQPRYKPQALFAASDGHPVFGEVRCIVALPKGKAPWIAGQLMRLSRTSKVNASDQVGDPGSGTAVLYRPPAH